MSSSPFLSHLPLILFFYLSSAPPLSSTVFISSSFLVSTFSSHHSTYITLIISSLIHLLPSFPFSSLFLLPTFHLFLLLFINLFLPLSLLTLLPYFLPTMNHVCFTIIPPSFLSTFPRLSLFLSPPHSLHSPCGSLTPLVSSSKQQ